MYLGPVYGSEEIARQMPKERQEFSGADAKWRRIMQGVQRQPEILQVGCLQGLYCMAIPHILHLLLHEYVPEAS
jgi:dynein heavy chain